MVKVIEARALITAQDQTGKAFASVAKKIDDMSKVQSRMAKSGSAEVQAMTRRIEGMTSKLNQIEGFRKLSRDLDQASIAMKRTAQEAARLKAGVDGTGRPIEATARDIARAARAADQAAEAFRRQGRAVLEVRAGLSSANIPINNLAAAQKQLEDRIKGANAALERQKALEVAKPKSALIPTSQPPNANLLPPRLSPADIRRLDGHPTIVEGAGVIGTILGGGKVVVDSMRAGMDVDTERSQARQAGWTEEEIKSAEKRANQLGQHYGVAPGSALNLIREARPTFGGDLNTTLGNIQPFFDVLTAMRQKSPQASDQEHTRALGDMIKAGEILGYSSDPNKLREYADFMAKMTQVHGSALRPGEVLNFAKRAKSAGSSAEMDFLKSAFPTMLPELGGDGLGTALMTLRQALVGGKMKKRAAENLAELGLVNPSGLIQTDDQDVKGVKADAIVGRDLVERNPLAWAEKYLVPAMDAKGYGPEQRAGLISTLFSDRNAEHMINLLVTQRDRLAKDRAVVEKAEGLQGAQKALRDDPYLGNRRVTAAAGSAGAALTDPLMPVLKGTQKIVAEGLNAAADAARSNPAGAVGGVTGGAAAGGYLGAILSQGSGALPRLAMLGAGATGGALLGGAALPFLLREAYPDLKKQAEKDTEYAFNRSGRGVPMGDGRFFTGYTGYGDKILERLEAGTQPGRSMGFKFDDVRAVLTEPINVTGKLDPVELKGRAEISVTFKASDGARVTGIASSSSGNLSVTPGVALGEFPGAAD